MNTLSFGYAVVPEFKPVTLTVTRRQTVAFAAGRVQKTTPHVALPHHPIGMAFHQTPHQPKSSCRRRRAQLVTSAESTAVETLPASGPEAHPLTSWDTATGDIQVVEAEDGTQFIIQPHPAAIVPEGTSSYNQALLNSVNILMGVGLLSIPFALKEGGWAAMGVLAAIWTGTNYTGKILIKCQEVNRNRKADDAIKGSTSMFGPGKLLRSYEDIGEAAFGVRGRQFITTVLYAELLGTCALFYIMEGDHLHFLLSQLMPPYLDVPSKEQLMALTAGVFLPTTWMPNVGALSALGFFGLVSSLGMTGVVGYEMVHNGFQFADTLPLNMATLPSSFGLLAFVFAGHAVFPSIYGSMKNKEEYPKMLNTTYLIVGAVCILTGSAGYLLYGSNTAEEVTLNLPAGMLSVFATSLLLFSPFAKFALTLEPVARGVEEKFNLSMKGSTANWARLNRTALGAGCLVLATQIPFFAQVMSIVGSFLTLTVSVIFPSICYMKLYGADIKNSEKLMNYSVISLGIACATSGTWTAVNEVVKQLT